MKYKILGTTLITTLFTSCVSVSHNTPPAKAHRLISSPKNNTITLSNEGTICAYKQNINSMIIKYYPLSTSCAPSSLYNWKLNGIETKVVENKVAVNSYSLYKRANSQIVTTDCAGAGVKIKQITTPTPNTILYWGKTKLATISPNQDIVCFKRVGNSFIKVKPIQ